MHRIRWYGPTVLLLATTLVVMIAGPYIARRIVWHQTEARIELVRQSLTENASLDELSRAFEAVAEVVGPSVVHIEVLTRRDPRTESRDLFRRFPDLDAPGNSGTPGNTGRPGTPDGSNDSSNALRRFGNGSGWVWDDKGHIVTNNHVITLEDNQTPVEEIRVKFADGTTRRAQIVQADRRSDLAVLRVEGAPLHPAARAEQGVRQGEIVFAFGSPFGNEFSMSQGIVSGMGRRLQFTSDPLSHEQYIQTDAAVNPGNSGGPLVNLRGQVVGVNNAILTRTGFSNGVGYAIPIAQVERVVTQMIEHGQVQRGYIGIVIDDDPKWFKAKGYDGRGVFVLSLLTGEPADQAGMRNGDIVLSVQGIKTPTVSDLKEVISNTEPGTQLTLRILRKDDPNEPGQELELRVTVAQQPGAAEMLALSGAGPDGPQPAATPPDPRELLAAIGLENVEDFTRRTARRMGIPFTPGVAILEVRRNSVAEVEGFRRGMVIIEVRGLPVETIEQLLAALETQDLTRGVVVTVVDPITQSRESRLLRIERR